MGNQILRVCDRSGYDFAILYWQTCPTCRHGHIAKISIAPERQRQRYGTRMVLRAMRGCASYTWTTTGQSPDAQRFFPVLAHATGAAFTPRGRTCPHMNPGNPAPGAPQLERDPGSPGRRRPSRDGSGR
ncbi:hypothetical protein [Streptodolium elevatio]|uniref:N-acetyltransferase domain-containing protein n=1 Tax=Streptodolium elevatio TaxID=3157996 RepID=A0ABV3DL96_9ACTN